MTLLHSEGDWAVSTTKVFERWETAINRPENGQAAEPLFGYKYKWLIVETYDDVALAFRGHQKWVNLMQDDSHRELEAV